MSYYEGNWARRKVLSVEVEDTGTVVMKNNSKEKDKEIFEHISNT